MDHITVYIQPFVFNQTVGVYSNGECIKSIKCKINELDKVCMELCKAYNMHQIDLGGSQPFAQRVKNKIVENKFENYEINVDIH